MSADPAPKKAEFDQFASNYDVALEQGLAISGENREFFAHGRVVLLAARLEGLRFRSERILDFGCGTGASTPLLLEIPGAKSVTGVDTSAKSLEIAEHLHSRANVRFNKLEEFSPAAEFDLAFTNGVFHHIPPAERAAAIRSIFAALKPGGLFALWENNPWNPGTRLVMRRIPFDRDAIMLSHLEAKERLRQGGFEIIAIDFAFYFPRALAFLRPIEPALRKVPFGSQYMVLGRKRV